MDEVLGRESHHHVAVQREVELVANRVVVGGAELTVGSRVGVLPLKLLGVHGDRVGVRRHAVAPFDLFPVVVADQAERHDRHGGEGGPPDLPPLFSPRGVTGPPPGGGGTFSTTTTPPTSPPPTALR